MKKPAILALSFSLLSSVLFSQNVTSRNQSVIDSGRVYSLANSTELPFFTSSADAEKIVAGIMDALGMEGSFKIRVANVPNLEATIRHHRRYILYNPEFVGEVNTATRNKWASIFMLAHEIGHHVEGHTLVEARNRPNVELQADQFAGFALCKMGASLEQAQMAIYFIAGTEASKSHPGRADRLKAIEKGWDKAASQLQNGIPNTTVAAQ